ncbi:hypothetical protein TEA_008251 [Camellia sinensis var. sinensis]|uniref:Uncharacterized protein n=1 Tax=Camellia sinensis var. sinensis TaxID=542762 RepID=A0A4S4DD82_CAMSN|nr:hypothetical protein TEA_008251 [Camellia sinensis var. sinensis]
MLRCDLENSQTLLWMLISDHTAYQGKPMEVRQAAGLLLKNNLRAAFKSMASPCQQHIKSELLPCLGAADRHIRSTAGTIISELVQIGGVFGWPELLHTLVQCLDSNDLNHMEGAMDALSKICEDIPQVLDSEMPGLTERPINVFLPRLLQSSHASLRKLSLGSVNQFIMLMPQVLYLSMDKYLQGLFILANDPAADVRKLVSCLSNWHQLIVVVVVAATAAAVTIVIIIDKVCAAFVQLIEVRPAFLEVGNCPALYEVFLADTLSLPHLRNVIEYMLQVNKDPDDEVSLEACEFWSAYCGTELPPENLREFLPHLIPILLSNMVYADDDESLVVSEEDGSLPDRDQDLRPRFHSSRFHGSENAEDEDDDVVNIWNLRKCSAAALDILSNMFGDEILPTLMPIVQSRLSTTDDVAWKEREAAVLALGAIAEGCINGLYPHLSEIVAFLTPRLDDKFPLIRSISCWTVSRFSKFIIQSINHQEGREQFDEVLMGILRRILDDNKRVQEAACSAFATLEEEAAEELAPRLEIILQHLMCAFGKYQRRNLQIVYDAIGTLADAVGGELNQPKYIDVMMPPLIAKWQQLSNSDKDLFPLLECFTSIAQALGTGFSQFAQPVFQRCIDIIHSQYLAKTLQTKLACHLHEIYVSKDQNFVWVSVTLMDTPKWKPWRCRIRGHGDTYGTRHLACPLNVINFFERDTAGTRVSKSGHAMGHGRRVNEREKEYKPGRRLPSLRSRANRPPSSPFRRKEYKPGRQLPSLRSRANRPPSSPFRQSSPLQLRAFSLAFGFAFAELSLSPSLSLPRDRDRFCLLLSR